MIAENHENLVNSDSVVATELLVDLKNLQNIKIVPCDTAVRYLPECDSLSCVCRK